MSKSAQPQIWKLILNHDKMANALSPNDPHEKFMAELRECDKLMEEIDRLMEANGYDKYHKL